jgi:hypothetical protein
MAACPGKLPPQSSDACALGAASAACYRERMQPEEAR